MMVGLICVRCQVAMRPADSAMRLSTHCTWSVWHSLPAVLTCTGCMKLTNADPKKIALATWCMQFMMLVSSTV